LSVAFAKDSGTGTVSGLTSATASAGVATFTVTGVLAASLTPRADATAAGGPITTATLDKLTFSVINGGATKIVLSGGTANLASGSTRLITATIHDAAALSLPAAPPICLSVAFAKDSGTGTVSGLTSATASAGVATFT